MPSKQASPREGEGRSVAERMAREIIPKWTIDKRERRQHYGVRECLGGADDGGAWSCRGIAPTVSRGFLHRPVGYVPAILRSKIDLLYHIWQSATYHENA